MKVSKNLKNNDSPQNHGHSSWSTAVSAKFPSPISYNDKRCCPFLDSSGEQVHLLRLDLSVPRREQEMEEPISFSPRLVQHQRLRQQIGKYHLTGALVSELVVLCEAWLINVALSLGYQSHDKHFQPKGSINCAGYKVLMSMEQYLDLISNSLPGEDDGEEVVEHCGTFYTQSP